MWPLLHRSQQPGCAGALTRCSAHNGCLVPHQLARFQYAVVIGVLIDHVLCSSIIDAAEAISNPP